MIKSAIQYKLKLLGQNLFDLALYSIENKGVSFIDITDEQCEELAQKALNSICEIMGVEKDD